MSRPLLDPKANYNNLMHFWINPVKEVITAPILTFHLKQKHVWILNKK